MQVNRRLETMRKGGRSRAVTILAVFACGWILPVYAQNCHNVDVRGDQPFGQATDQRPGACAMQLRNGFPVSDPSCTPGAFNPTVTLNVIDDPEFSTTIP